MIKFISANKWFGDHYVLKNINLKIEKGEVVNICGPSGAGKSTLLRTINKLEQIDDGEIIVDDRYLSDPRTDLTALRAEIGMVFQHFNLYPHKTVKRQEYHTCSVHGEGSKPEKVTGKSYQPPG